MEFLDKRGLSTFLNQLKKLFGIKNEETGDTTPSKDVFDASYNNRKKYLYMTEEEYNEQLGFNKTQIVGDNSPYVGSATVGNTYVA